MPKQIHEKEREETHPLNVEEKNDELLKNIVSHISLKKT
jgi:hypothetical protein